jgi:lysine decarboxylase
VREGVESGASARAGRAQQDGASPPAAQQATPYIDALRRYAAENPLRLNVPGHQNAVGAVPGLVDVLGPAVFDLDLPLLMPGVDAGDAPTPREQSEHLAAQAWGARRTWFLTNGASQGNLVACIVASILGREVLVQRNMHSSVLSGVILAGLRPTFTYPTIDEHLGVAHVVGADAIAAAIDAAAEKPAMVFVVSPTYFGATADIAAIAAVCHSRGIPLVVDEAWAAHFGSHPELPPSAIESGADLVISSTHKLVGSLTQSAMLHLRDGGFAELLEPLVERALTLVESTSASSLLMASLDGARRWRAVEARDDLPAALAEAEDLRRRVEALPGLAIADRRFTEDPDIAYHDPLRVVIDVSGTGHSGIELRGYLREEHRVDLEVFTHAAIVAIVGPRRGVHPESGRLVDALRDLPPAPQGRSHQPVATVFYAGAVRLTPGEALVAPSELVDFEHAVGRVSSDTLAAYPPGIPNIVGGEEFTAELLEYLAAVDRQGGYVRGDSSPAPGKLRVVKN